MWCQMCTASKWSCLGRSSGAEKSECAVVTICVTFRGSILLCAHLGHEVHFVARCFSLLMFNCVNFVEEVENWSGGLVL